MPRTCWLIMLVCLSGPWAAAGQEASAVEPPPPLSATEPASTTSNSLPETEITLDKSTQVVAGLGFSGPLGAGVGVRILHGLGADVRDDGSRVEALCALPIPHCAGGFTVDASAGSGGGKLSLGIGARARVNEEDFRGTAGVGLRLALARTWGSPIGTEPGLSYLGPELDLSVLRVNVTLGVLWRVSGQGGASVLFSWGLGFGL